jgi:hypothetical protein
MNHLNVRALALSTVAVALLAGCATNSHDLGPSNNIAGSTGAQNLVNGVPVGSWGCKWVNDTPVMTFTIRSSLMFDARGGGHLMSVFDGAYKGGYKFGVGKFTGLRRVTWQTASHYTKISRVGNELYCYRQPTSQASLVSGNPAGYSLRDYMSLGGGLTGGAYDAIWGKRNDAGLDVYSIQGKNLVLENSTDGRRWLFKVGSVR